MFKNQTGNATFFNMDGLSNCVSQQWRDQVKNAVSILNNASKSDVAKMAAAQTVLSFYSCSSAAERTLANSHKNRIQAARNAAIAAQQAALINGGIPIKFEAGQPDAIDLNTLRKGALPTVAGEITNTGDLIKFNLPSADSSNTGLPSSLENRGGASSFLTSTPGIIVMATLAVGAGIAIIKLLK